MSEDEFDVISVPAVAAPASAPGHSNVEDLVAAADGDGPARLRVEYSQSQRAQEDARGHLRTAKAKHAAALAKKAPADRLTKLDEAIGRAQRVLEQADTVAAAAQLRVQRAAALREQASEHGGEESPTGRLLRFTSVVEFVNEYALPNFGHPVQGQRAIHWCENWWLHPSALSALDALWEAFETMRLSPPPALATWTRDYFWPFMYEVTRADGPFHSCARTGSEHRPGHSPEQPWPSNEPPSGFVQTYPSETDQLRLAAEKKEA